MKLGPVFIGRCLSDTTESSASQRRVVQFDVIAPPKVAGRLYTYTMWPEQTGYDLDVELDVTYVIMSVPSDNQVGGGKFYELGAVMPIKVLGPSSQTKHLTPSQK